MNDDTAVTLTKDETIRLQAAEIERLHSELAQWKRAANEGHQHPCTLGPLCPYCEIERLNSELLAERFANIGKVHPCDDSTAANLASALADNERLREENKVLAETLLVKEMLPEIVYEEKEDKIKRLAAEIERLRNGSLFIEQAAELTRLRTEVEQLREENGTLRTNFASTADQIINLERMVQEMGELLEERLVNNGRLCKALSIAKATIADLEACLKETKEERDAWEATANHHYEQMHQAAANTTDPANLILKPMNPE